MREQLLWSKESISKRHISGLLLIRAIVQSLRPKQWTKNLLLFSGLLFSQNLLETTFFIKVTLGFILFSILSGGVYLINDIVDLKQDRLHPLKSQRPLASGRLPVPWAIVTALILLSIGLSLSFHLQTEFGWVALIYLLLTMGYTLIFKHVIILDVLIIAVGFVLRAIAGAVVIDVSISSWLLICTTFLALFLALTKRRHELVLLQENAVNHRKILNEYSTYLLDQMISVVTASTVMAYALYTTSSETVEKFGTRKLIWTLPFVIFGIFRYLYLVHKKNMGGSPEHILIKDRSLAVNIFLYVLTVVFILYGI